MFLLKGRALAELALRFGPIALDAAHILRKWIKKEHVQNEDLPARLGRLERNMELQSQLNEQFLAEMEMLKPAMEGIQRYFMLIFLVALFAGLLSLLSLILILIK